VTPVPTPAPTLDEPDVAPLTIVDARSYLPDALKDKYGTRFSRSGFTRACNRYSVAKVRCRVAWRKSPYKYTGTVTLWNDPEDPEGSYVYSTSIKRKRTKSSKQTTRNQGSAPAAQPSCNPNYSGVCLQNGGDVNCGDISATNFRSTGSDPFRLDGDGDGIACES
jgi:hypothetical protein